MLDDEVPLDFRWFTVDNYVLCCRRTRSKSFDKAKGFVSHPEARMFYCKKITDTTILYLKEKVKSGVDAAGFDSWGECYLQLIIKSLGSILIKLSKLCRSCSVIVFAKDAGLR
jgi:uroporphyrinogen-III decarboxylase